MEPTKLLIVGLDGATLDLVGPWVAQGKLPHMAGLMAKGNHGPLRSVLPVLSSAAWASFMTGMNPGKHGVFDFVRREPGGYRLRLVSRQQMRGASLWQLLGRRGFQVGVLNVPMTYPPEEVNGWLASGLGTPDYRPFTYPPGLGQELLARGYQVNKQVFYHPDNEERFLQEVNQTTEKLTESALWLFGERAWDFGMLVYRDTDELQHFFWRHMDPNHPAHNPDTDHLYADAILRYYQKVDDELGKLLTLVGPETTVIVLSDHGGGPLYRDVFLNEWLRQNGFLATAHTGVGLPIRQRLLARLGLTRSGVSTTLRSLRLGRLERWIKDQLGDRIEMLPRAARAEFPGAIDWSRTRAYSFGYHGQIYINLIGREPEGIVAPGEEYEQACREISAALETLTDPGDGKPVVDAVIRGDQAYHGPCIQHAPDLIVVMRDLAYITRQGYEFSDQSGQIFSDPITHESGSHRMDGLLIMSGPGIASKGAMTAGADLIDIAPTVLHLMGCPVPSEMDGQTLLDWLTVDRPVQIDEASIQEKHPDEATQPWTPDEEAELVDRLRNLGYLE